MWVLHFEVTTGTKGIIGGGYYAGGIAETAEHGAAVDVIEFLGVGPGFFGVVYFEAAV